MRPKIKMIFLGVLVLIRPLFAAPLRVNIPHHFDDSCNILKSSSAEREMVVLPAFAVSLGKSHPVAPIFGKTTDAQVFYNGILLNDPAVPSGMANLQYINRRQLTYEGGNTFEVSSKCAYPLSVAGGLGPIQGGMDLNVELPTRGSPTMSQRTQRIGNESMTALNLSLKDQFWLTPDTRLSFALMKIKGSSLSYMSLKSNTPSSASYDQHGGRLQLLSSNKLELALKYATIEQYYENYPIHSQTQEVESAYQFLSFGTVGLHILHEARGLPGNILARFVPDLFFKNSHMKVSAALWEHHLCPSASIYGKHVFNDHQKIYVEGLFQKKPVKLSQLLVAASIHGEWRETRSDLTPETLLGARIAFQHTEKKDHYTVEVGTDYLLSSIYYDYKTHKNFNHAQDWGKPFIKLGLSLKDHDKHLILNYKHISPLFAPTPEVMMNTAQHHWDGKFMIHQPHLDFTAKFDMMVGINRFNETLNEAQEHGYEGHLSFRMDLTLHKPVVVPFAEVNFMVLDASVRHTHMMTFWVGLGFGIEER